MKNKMIRNLNRLGLVFGVVGGILLAFSLVSSENLGGAGIILGDKYLTHYVKEGRFIWGVVLQVIGFTVQFVDTFLIKNEK